MSATIVVDSLAYARKLEQAGFSRQQAEAQAEVFQEQGERLRAALQPILAFYEEATRKDLATRGDVLDTRLEIEKVRAEVEKVRVDVEKSKYALLKWQIGIGLTLLTVMARGFGWIG